MLHNKPTSRGFSRYSFVDRNGKECSLQKSSIATEDCIWLGCNEIELKRQIPGFGWVDIPTPSEGPYGTNHIANTRMHLTQQQVADLLPLLQKFVDTGEIE